MGVRRPQAHGLRRRRRRCCACVLSEGAPRAPVVVLSTPHRRARDDGSSFCCARDERGRALGCCHRRRAGRDADKPSQCRLALTRPALPYYDAEPDYRADGAARSARLRQKRASPSPVVTSSSRMMTRRISRSKPVSGGPCSSLSSCKHPQSTLAPAQAWRSTRLARRAALLATRIVPYQCVTACSLSML